MIPDALKPAICPICHGRGHVGCRICNAPGFAPGYGSDLDGHIPDNEPCSTCGGSGINPDMIRSVERVTHVKDMIPGRYVVIPLGGSNE